MQFKEFIDSLDEKAKEDYAKSVGTSKNYLINQYYYARKIPRKDRFESLWQNTNLNVSRAELVNHFYGTDKQAAA